MWMLLSILVSLGLPWSLASKVWVEITYPIVSNLEIEVESLINVDPRVKSSQQFYYYIFHYKAKEAEEQTLNNRPKITQLMANRKKEGHRQKETERD